MTEDKPKIKVDPSRIAPTWLYNSAGEKALFRTQEEVDDAWDNGWGPPEMFSGGDLISQRTFSTKKALELAIASDPRYSGLAINTKRSMAECMDRVIKFENQEELDEINDTDESGD